MNDLVLTLAIRWLAAEDAFAVSCVSSEWQETLSGDRDNGDLWKQVCQNSSYPLVPADLQSSTDMEYRRLALGLWRGRVPRSPATTCTYTPTLGMEDLFAVVDIYQKSQAEGGTKRRKSMIGSWMCPISGPNLLVDKQMSNDDSKVTLKGPNPYSASGHVDSEEVGAWLENVDYKDSMPYRFAFRNATGGNFLSPRGVDRDKVFRVNVTLFRRDSMKSVRILEDTKLVDWDCDENEEWISCFGEALCFAATDAGKTVRSMMYDEGLTGMHVSAGVTLASKVPASGSVHEPAWLVNCRQAYQQRQFYHPDQNDQDGLSRISHFEFELKSFWLALEVLEDGDYDAFENQNAMMVALEGLCWE